MLDFQATRWLMDKEVPPQAGNDHPTSHSDRRVQDLGRPHQHRRRRPEDVGEVRLAVRRRRLQEPRFRRRQGPLQEPQGAQRADREAHRQEAPPPTGSSYFNANGCPAGEINSIDQVFGLEQVRHLGLAQPMDSQERGATEIVGQPILMSRSKASVASAAANARPAHRRSLGRDRLRRRADRDAEG